MNNIFQNRCSQFIEKIPSENLTAFDLLSSILDFLHEINLALEEEPISAYRLNKFATQSPEDYPVKFTSSSEAEVNHLRVVLQRSKGSSGKRLAQLLRDTLEQLLIFEIDCDCPRCSSAGMGIFKNGFDGRLASMCKHCGYGVYLDGSKMEPAEFVAPTISDLKGVGLI